jgi:hypothetical protein
MLSFIFDDTAERTRAKAIGLYGLLLAGNVSAWGWALAEFGDKPVLLGLAVGRLPRAFSFRSAIPPSWWRSRSRSHSRQRRSKGVSVC